MTLWTVARRDLAASRIARAGLEVTRFWRSRWRVLLRGDGGMSTAEYAIGTLAAAAFASLLYAVVTSDTVREALTSLVQRALEGTL